MTQRQRTIVTRLSWLSLCATLALTSQYEWQAGIFAGLHPVVAAALPLSIDVYVVAALLAGRDVRLALSVLWASVAAGAVHGATNARQLAIQIVLGTVLTLVLWRVHHLAHPATTTATEPATVAVSAPAAVAVPPPATPRHQVAGPRLAVAALPVAEQVAWLHRELAAHPHRTVAEWADLAGWTARTAARRLADARALAA